MKAVIYARYSSDNQREESIEGQIRECTEYAEYNDMEIVGTYIDRAYSARTDHRPEFQRMIKDSEKKQFDVVLVWKLDRFARDRFDSAHYKRILKKNGARVISAKETISQGAEGILMESMLEGMAEYYSAELSEKTKRGMKENALKCKVNGVVVPLGYVEDGEHRFAIDEAYAPVVREVFALYLDGKGYKDIAHFLAEKGIRQKNGKPITPNVVYTMLRNRKYIGEYKFGDTVIENGVPRIISDDLFNAVQNKIAQNRKAPARKKAIDEYLLTTKLFCGKCGAMMVGESGHSMTGRIYQYYRCVHTKKVKTCDKKPVRKDWIEDLVVAEAIRILSDQGIVEQLADRLYEMQGEENAYLQSLRRSLSETEKSLSNVMRAIEQGIITETTKVRLMELEEERKKIEGEIGAEQLRHPMMTREEILFGIEKFAKLDTSTQDGRRKLIDGFINSVYLYDDKAVINFNGTREARTVSLEEVESSGSADKPQPSWADKKDVTQKNLGFTGVFGCFTAKSTTFLRVSFLSNKVQNRRCFLQNYRVRRDLNSRHYKNYTENEKSHTEREENSMAYSYKCSISFGLVYIPVTLHASVKTQDVGFNMLDKKTMSRVKYKKTCEECDGREVKQEDIVKGYEYEDDKYVVFTEEDFEKLKTKKDKNITIQKFVDIAQIDPIYYDRPYYVNPTGAENAYALLLRAMEEEKKVGIAKTVLGNKETLIALRAKDGQMLLNTLFFADEIQKNPTKEVRAEFSSSELSLAKSIVEGMSGDFKAEDYKDEYRERVKAAIEQKIAGKEIVKAKEGTTNVAANLMEALQASLKGLNKPTKKVSRKAPAVKKEKRA